MDHQVGIAKQVSWNTVSDFAAVLNETPVPSVLRWHCFAEMEKR